MPFNGLHKKLFLFFCFIFLVLYGKAQTSSAEEKILLDLEKLRSEAITTHHLGNLNNIYHDQFRGVTANGSSVDKKGQLEILKSVPADVLFSIDEFKASIYGYAGVTSGKLIGKSKDGTMVSQLRFMHVYIKRNGQWKIIEGQDTGITP